MWSSLAPLEGCTESLCNDQGKSVLVIMSRTHPTPHKANSQKQHGVYNQPKCLQLIFQYDIQDQMIKWYLYVCGRLSYEIKQARLSLLISCLPKSYYS